MNSGIMCVTPQIGDVHYAVWGMGIDQSILFKINSTGDTLWSRNFRATPTGGKNLHVSGNDVVMVARVFSLQDSVYAEVRKISGDGTLLWARRSSGVQDISHISSTVLADGSILVSCTCPLPDGQRVRLTMLSMDGDLIWSKDVMAESGLYIEQIAPTNEGSILAVGSYGAQGITFKISPAGAITNGLLYTGPLQTSGILLTSIVVRPDNIEIWGLLTEPGTNDAILRFALSTEGSINGARYYGPIDLSGFLVATSAGTNSTAVCYNSQDELRLIEIGTDGAVLVGRSYGTGLWGDIANAGDGAIVIGGMVGTNAWEAIHGRIEFNGSIECETTDVTLQQLSTDLPEVGTTELTINDQGTVTPIPHIPLALNYLISDPCGTNGLEEAQPQDLEVFPNPVLDRFSIDLRQYGQPFEMVMFSAQGNEVDRKLLAGLVELNVIDLRPGPYYMTLRSGDHYFRSKLIKLSH